VWNQSENADVDDEKFENFFSKKNCFEVKFKNRVELSEKVAPRA